MIIHSIEQYSETQYIKLTFCNIQIQPTEEKITKEEAENHCETVLSAIMKTCVGLIADSKYQDTLAHCAVDVSVSITENLAGCVILS